MTAAPAAAAAWPSLPRTVRPRFEKVLGRLARNERVRLTHESSGKWSARLGVKRGKTVSARGSRRDRMFLVRLATHILAVEGDIHVEWIEVKFQDYEKDKKRRLGEDSVMPKRIKYKQFSR